MNTVINVWFMLINTLIFTNIILLQSVTNININILLKIDNL